MSDVATSAGKIRVMQIRSGNGQKPGQQATLIGLGLNKLHRVRELDDTPAIRGMVRKVHHLVTVTDLAANAPSTAAGEDK